MRCIADDVMVEEVRVPSPGNFGRLPTEAGVDRSVTAEQRFHALFRAHYQAIVRYAARRTTASGIDPDDIVAETFAVAWRRRESLPVGHELAWLYGIAALVLSNQLRSQRRALRLYERLSLFARARHVSAEDDAGARAELDSLAAAFASLRASDAEVLRLAAWEGLSSSEIAVVLGCSENAAAIRLHRARKRLEEAVLKESRGGGHIEGEMPSATEIREVDADEIG